VICAANSTAESFAILAEGLAFRAARRRGDLLRSVRGWGAEGHAAIVVGLGGSGKIELRQGDFLVLGRKGPQSLADDGVVLDFELVLIAEHEHRGGQDRSAFWLGFFLLPARRARIRILIAVGLFLAKHLLFLEVLRIHLVSERAITLVVLVIRRARVPPPPGIDSRVPPGIAKTPAADAEAVVAESEVTIVVEVVVEVTIVVAESVVAESMLAEAGIAESIVQKGTARHARASRRNVSEAARHARVRRRNVSEAARHARVSRRNMSEAPRHARAMHSAEGVAPYSMGATETTMAASETTVAGEATAMSSAEAPTMSTTEAAGVSSAMLRPRGYGQEKRERRDGSKATHTGHYKPDWQERSKGGCQELVKCLGHVTPA